MSKKILILLLLCLPLGATLQAKFGYLSYNELFKAMPEYAAAQDNLNKLKQKYDKEAVRAEEEFQRKFADFLQGQKDFPANIMQKRQKELQDLQEKGIAFKEEVQKLLALAEQELQATVVQKLNEAIKAVGTERGYSYIVNTDGQAYPYINPAEGEDATLFVKEKLQLISVQ